MAKWANKRVICSNCGSVGHSTFDCRRQEKRLHLKNLERERRIRAKKESRDARRKMMEWGITKNKWYNTHPCDWQGLYYCHYCDKPLSRQLHLIAAGFEHPTLDHMHPISSIMGEKYRHELSNLVISCEEDNKKKSAMSYTAFCRRFYPHLMAWPDYLMKRQKLSEGSFLQA